MHWRCWRKDCRAPITTDACLNHAGAPVNVIVDPGEHNHPVDFDLISDTLFSQRCKELIRQDPSCSLRKVYDRVCTEFAQQGRQRQVPDFERVRMTLHRARRFEMPPIPRTINDVIIDGVWAETWNGEHWLKYANRNIGLFVFTTNDNLDKLSQCTDIHVDGTFKSVPAPFRQFVTIHGSYRGELIPLVFCLLMSKVLAF